MLFLTDRFVMWSPWHYLYIASPFILMFLLWILLRKAKFGLKYAVGVIIGIVSLSILIMRNVDIYINNGHKLDPEIIPLQICHFGNIMVFIALVFRSKIAGSISWTLNLVCAFLSLVFADSLPHYSNVWCIRAQAYIWGHLLIVLGAMYAIIMKIVRIDFKSFMAGIGIIIAIMIPAIVMNSWFNDLHKGEYSFVNYFYIYNSKGVPLEFLQDIMPRAQYGWFTIDWIYSCSLIAIALPIIIGFYFLQKVFYIKDKTYYTENVILWFVHRHKEKPIVEENIKVEIPYAVTKPEEENFKEEKEDYFKDLKRTKIHYKKIDK